jgi:hypothetical protein
LGYRASVLSDRRDETVDVEDLRGHCLTIA